MVQRLNSGETLRQLRVVALDVLHELVLGTTWASDQDRAGFAQGKCHRRVPVRICQYSGGAAGAACLSRTSVRSLIMQTGVGEPRIGQWYRHFDKGQIFQVTGLDQPSRTIEIQGFDGDLDEIDQEVWAGLPLGLAEAPEDWTGPVDVTGDELDGQGSEMNAADWVDQLQSRANMELWEDTRAPEERDAESDSQERLALDIS